MRTAKAIYSEFATARESVTDPVSWQRLRGRQRNEQALQWETAGPEGGPDRWLWAWGAVGGLTRSGHLWDWLGERVYLPLVAAKL